MKKRIIQMAGILTGILILVGLIHFVGIQKLYGIFRQTDPVSMTFALIIYASSWVSRTLRLKRLTDFSGKKIRLLDLFKLHISGYAFNAILPARLGDVVTIGYLKMKGIKIGRSMAIVLQTRILDLMALILLSVPAVLFLLKKTSPFWLISSILISVGVVALILGIVVWDKNQKLADVILHVAEKSKRRIFCLMREKLSQAYRCYHEMVSDRKLLSSTLAFSLFIWLFDGMTCMAVFYAFSSQIRIVPCILAVAVANVAKSIPFTPGGIGIYETALATTLVLFGVPFELAAAVGIADHFMKKMFNIVVGFSATAAMKFKFKQIGEIAAQIKETYVENP